MARQHRGAVLVTGAGGGMGIATVHALAEAGYTVFAGTRSAAAYTAGRFPPQVHPVVIDVTEPASVTAAAEQVTRAARGLHAVVNMAGVIVQGPVELVSDAELRRQFDVNVYGPMAVMRAFLPLLRAGTDGRPGRVVNISAATARTAVPFLGPISASKAALESLSDAARVELAPFGVDVVLVEPGAMQTPIFDKAAAAARASLAAAPADRRALYEPAIEAVTASMARQKTSPVQVAASAVVEAVTAAKPKARYTAGRDASTLIMVSRLPTRTRDRLLAGSLGLSKLASPPAAAAHKAAAS